MEMMSKLPDGSGFEFWEKTDYTWTKELFVDNRAENASDDNDGREETPFRTIQAAADAAVPGTRVVIKPGVYRECVRPRRGGEGPDAMISYEAAQKDTVIIKASEQVTDFEPSRGWMLWPRNYPLDRRKEIRVFRHRLDPDMFRGYNPFCAINLLHDRLFIEYDKTEMTPYLNRRGVVFCDGKPLRQVPLTNDLGLSDGTYWVEANGMAVHFRLPGDELPEDHVIEISCREQCFAPEEEFLSYIRVRGLICAHASMGAPIPQRGAISAARGHHWIIEDCTVEWSNATGIDVGDECWHHTWNPSRMIGMSVIRRCVIRDCGVCGIAGLFAVNMLVEDNLIEGTGWQKMELSWEAAGLKFHNTVNSLIRRNVFRRTFRADHLWLDCGNVNNRITGNLFLDGIEQREAIFIECTREGVNLIDHNIFWNVEGRFDPKDVSVEPGSSGWYKLAEHNVVNGWAVYGEGTDRLRIEHNLIGKCASAGYFARPVPFRLSSRDRGGTSRDARITNNIFCDCGEAAIKFPTEKNTSEGNLFVNMGGGYLRILFPAPEVCLDLRSWQEFYGFDLDGQEAKFDFCVDTEKLTLSVTPAEEEPEEYIGLSPVYRNLIFSPEEIRGVGTDELMSEDFFGEKTEGKRIPGPFAGLREGEIIMIDPRRTEG